MSDSRLSLIRDLEELAEELERQASTLRTAAETLSTLRDIDYHKERLRELKERAARGQ